MPDAARDLSLIDGVLGLRGTPAGQHRSIPAHTTDSHIHASASIIYLNEYRIKKPIIRVRLPPLLCPTNIVFAVAL